MTYSSDDIRKNRVLAAIGYVGILCFVPLLLRRTSPYAQAHASQATALFIVETIGFFIFLVPMIGRLLWLLFVLFMVGIALRAYVRALRGEVWEIPWITPLAKGIAKMRGSDHESTRT